MSELDDCYSATLLGPVCSVTQVAAFHQRISSSQSEGRKRAVGFASTSTPNSSALMAQTDEPIKLPPPPGKVLVFDHIVGKAYVADAPGPWRPSREAS